MKLMLRVFFIHFTLEDSNGSRYKRTKTHKDFPPDVTPEAAYAELEHKYGKSTNSDMWDGKLGCQIAPPQFIEINSHSIVDVEREKVELPSEKTYEVPLFDGVTLKSCLQDSPDLKAKKFKRRRK
jgi:hypothetical protein